MSTTDTKAINIFLSEVRPIVTKYDKIAQATGENFNIFSILGIENNEVGTHSKFIAHLLNPKGKHGLGNRFLELFLIQVGAKTHLDIKTASCKVERYIGKKIIKDCKDVKLKGMGMASEGGSIDIYLFDKQGKSISIENKIYAEDQEKQIVRYYNYNKYNNNNLVLYLTRYREDASKFSKGSLISDIDNTSEQNDFYCISYEETILKWLEKCQKEASGVPILRETIKQYKNLIKKITHQNINSEMNNKLITSILKDENSLNAYNSLMKLDNDLKKHMIADIIKKLKAKLKLKDEYFNIKSNELKNGSGLLISFQNKILEKNDLSIRLNFEAKDYSRLIIGFYNFKNKKESLKSEYLGKFREKFTKAKSTHLYPAHIDYEGYNYWNLDKLKEICFGFDEFYDDLEVKVKKMLEILE